MVLGYGMASLTKLNLDLYNTVNNINLILFGFIGVICLLLYLILIIKDGVKKESFSNNINPFFNKTLTFIVFSALISLVYFIFFSLPNLFLDLFFRKDINCKDSDTPCPDKTDETALNKNLINKIFALNDLDNVEKNPLWLLGIVSFILYTIAFIIIFVLFSMEPPVFIVANGVSGFVVKWFFQTYVEFVPSVESVATGGGKKNKQRSK